MDKNTRWVALGYAGCGALLAWISGRGLHTVLYWLHKYDTRIKDIELLGNNFTLANLIALLIVATLALSLWRKDSVRTSAHQVVEELRKVTWPSGEETKASTVVVVITTLVMAAILWFFDLAWSSATSFIYGTGAG